MYGSQDKKVSRDETDKIFSNLKGNKYLKIYPDAGHENLLKKSRANWLGDVVSFLNAN